jgi:hypothetical protein
MTNGAEGLGKGSLKKGIRERSLMELGLPVNAGWDQIQARYRRLVMSLHPDRNPAADAGERFQRVTEAYEHLCALRDAQRARSLKELSRLYDDPKIRELPLAELAMRLRYSSSPEVRAAVAFLLGTRAGGESRRLLLEAARDRDAGVSELVLMVLGEAGRLIDLLRCLPLAHRSLAGAFWVALGRAGGQSLRRFTAGLKRPPARKAVRKKDIRSDV